MKKTCILILVLVIPVMLFGGKIQFQAPDYENPHFRLIIPFETSSDKTILESISINGKDWLNFTAFKDGNNINITRPFDTGLYEIYLDYAWKSGKKYTIILSYRNKDSKQTSAHTHISISPEKGGIPDTAKEGFYRSLRLEEPVNMERRAEIVYWTFHGRKSLLSKETQALFNGTIPINYQNLVVQETIPPEKAAANHPVTLTYKIAFPVDLKPLEKKLF
ncbi:MAG: hypothetical protein KAX11_04730, partial [Candidatus Aminicenantes bacterium]|nr:hypothetical protein [Candidatus Aminicenantes bacterium]